MDRNTHSFAFSFADFLIKFALNLGGACDKPDVVGTGRARPSFSSVPTTGASLKSGPLPDSVICSKEVIIETGKAIQSHYAKVKKNNMKVIHKCYSCP